MKKLFRFLSLVTAFIFTVPAVNAQAEAITGLLNRIGGNGAADKFEIVIDETLDDENGKDVFVITAQNGKPCIKGNSQLSVATGINWYLNHYAHINLTWNKLSTDLVNVELPLPGEAVTKECAADLRYYLNYCTYSYTCAMWTEERWMQEIDWMALHGINMPLMLVGLDCVWYDLYTTKYGYTAEEISNYIAGPAFQAWWGMINCEGHGGPNPEWWYERSRALAANMLARMRSFGMEPVLPGFCGEVPSNLKTKLSNDSEINTGGTWQGFNAPGLMGHKSINWETLATNYYDALEGVMGTSKYYSMDPFHEGATGLTGNSANDVTGYFQSCYAQMKANVGEGVVWVAQDWDANPRSTMLTGLNKGELIVLDLFAEADPHYSSGYNGHDYIYCMLLNFGGRVGLHGRFNKTIDNYYAAMAARGDEMVGIGATPEGAENNPMLYDILFELPWRETAPDKTEWIKNYTVSRYGKENTEIQTAYAKLMQSVYNCTTSQQGTSEPIICAEPSLTATKVSWWSTSAVDYDHDIVIAAADGMLSQLNEFDASNDNFNYDLLDVVRQALTNYALDLLAQLNSDYSANGFDATFAARKEYYLALIEDIDELLGTHQKFRFGNWAEMARAIVTESAAANNGAGESDADWLEFANLRRQITTWANFWSKLRDYSNREWNGLIKDYYLERWKIYFDALENGTTGNLNDTYWYNYGNTYVYDNTKTYSATPVGDTRTVARSSFDSYFFSHTDSESNKVYFSRHIEQSKSATEYVRYAYRGNEFTFEIPNGTTATLSIDTNNDGIFGDGETVSSNTMTIPNDAATTTVKALIVLSDNTEISFYVFLADLIENERTVTVQAGDNGTVAIDGADGTSVTNTEYVTMTATGNSGYDFSHWVQVAGDGTETEASRENPFTYLGKAEATFKAYFIQNIWGIPGEDKSDWGDIATKQYLTSITCTQDENVTEIYTADAATESLFVPVGTAISAAKGSSFTINWQGDGNMKFSYLSAYIDLNKDGDFEDDDELIMVKGTLEKQDATVETGPMTIMLPYDMPIGITHIRLRFDGAWKSGYDATTKAFPADGTLNRRCYEIILNVTEHAAGSSHIVITSNNSDWGHVRNITGVTGDDINVPSGTEICMEAFPNDGYQFVHWLDKYGRVASTESNYYYTPCESGVFTAVFKKIAQETVVIDSWEFRIRTQPGTVVKTTKLDNGVKPEDGKTYYIYAYPQQSSGTGTYVARYLYDNNGTLATTEEVGATGYLWTCIENNDTYSFQNETGRYLANSNSTDCFLSIGTTAAAYTFEDPSYEGLTIYNPSSPGGKYMVTNAAGTSFNRYGSKANDGSWSSDYVFVEYSVPNDVILTEVITTGNNDLTIPETVMVDGVECKIIGFDNNLFNNNKELWSITLPQSIEFLSSNVLFSTSLNGAITPSTGGDALDSSKSQVIDLGGYALANNEAWTLDISFETQGKNSLYNQWGTILLSGGENASSNQWLYLSANGNGYLRTPGFSSLYNDSNDANNYFYEHTNGKISTFTISIANQGDGTAIVTVINSDGESLSSSAVSFSPNGVTKLSSYMTTGVNITNLQISKGEKPCAFSGCSNLDAINVVAGGTTYSSNDGCLYNTDGSVLLCTPEGKEKGAARRELAEVIENFSALIERIATIEPEGTVTTLPLTTDAGGDYFVSTNADQNTGGGNTDGAGISGLVDNTNDTYFHSRWGGTVAVNEPHYIQIDLGDENSIENFKFSYVAHNSPDPAEIVVSGSNNGTDFTPIDTITKTLTAVGNTYTSELFVSAMPYRYLHLAVTNSHGRGYGNKFGSYYCFGMKEFDLYKVSSSAEVLGIYTSVGVTNSEVAADYDALATAINVYENGTTAAEMTAQYNIIEPLYEALNAKAKPLNGVYHINYNSKPIFVGYREQSSISRDEDGYHLIDPTADETATGADEMFTIIVNKDSTGYLLSAQNLYLKTTHNNWTPQFFSPDEDEAGVYLFDETETLDVYKLKSDQSSKEYINDYGSLFGNDESTKDGLSTFTLTEVTEYTVTVPSSGVTTLCLPFNVVLPEGVEAYDIVANDITTAGERYMYSLSNVANEGETLLKGTPVIIKAAAGNVTFTITMDSEGAKGSTEGTVLHSNLVKTTIGTTEFNYTFTDGVFNKVTANTEVTANQCWMTLDEDGGAYIIDKLSINDFATLIEQMEELTALVGTYDPAGTADEIALQTTQGEPYYIYCNAPQSGSSVESLLDNTASTFFHSNWESTTAPADGLDHHLTIELGDGNGIAEFKFHYQARSGSNLGDFPTTIKVQGSNDGTNYVDITTVEPRNSNNGNITNGAEWTSEAIGNGHTYTYLRFMVTATTSNRNKDGHIYWHMAEFDLYHNISSSADVYSFLENGITNEQAATAYDVLLKAVNVYESSTTAEAVQTAKGELQSAYDTLDELYRNALQAAQEALPITLTTNEESPVLYKIFIKRTADVTVLQYDEASKKVAVANKADNSSYQAWYFMGTSKGVTIHPYNADGKVLSANSTNNAAGTVSAQATGTETFYEWTFVNRADGYYNIQAYDGSNYFSNNGGTTEKMGFWSDNPDSDTGSLFKFVAAEFSESNPRYYQLSDVKATMIDGTDVYEGTNVGLYTGGKAYREAYTTASSLVTDGNTSSSEDCHASYKALRAAYEGLSYNAPDPSKYYTIKSVSTNNYCAGKFVRTYYEPGTHSGGRYTGNFDHTKLVFDNKADIPQFALAVFQFEETGTQGEYKMKNLHTGLYVKAFAGTHMGAEAEAQPVKIAGFADGQVTLKIGNSAPMHARQDYGDIVQYAADTNNASLWTIDEVESLSDIKHVLSVSSAEYATLFLNYPVTIPDGITAYTAKGILNEGWLSMQEITDGIIPANTGVVLTGEEGEYEFVINNGPVPSSEEEALFKGTLYKQTITKNENDLYYILAIIDGEVGFGKPVNGENKDEFINAANKAYLYIAGEAVQASSFYRFSYDSSITTEIQGIEENENTPEGIYDLSGRKLAEITAPGMYIVNGKKVIIKE